MPMTAGWVGLARSLSAPVALPSVDASPVHVEQIVLDLKGQADGGGEARQRGIQALGVQRRRAFGGHQHAGANHRAGLARMHVFDLGDIELHALRPPDRSPGRRPCRRCRWPAPACRSSAAGSPEKAAAPDRGPAAETPAAAAHRPPAARWPRRRPCGRSAGRGAGRRRPWPADRRAPASRRAPARWRRPPPRPRPRDSPSGACGGEHQCRTDALAAAQHAVAHGLVQAGRAPRRRAGSRAASARSMRGARLQVARRMRATRIGRAVLRRSAASLTRSVGDSGSRVLPAHALDFADRDCGHGGRPARRIGVLDRQLGRHRALRRAARAARPSAP